MTQANRKVPVLPPIDKPIKIILDTDFANEIDDLFALALALVSPKRIHLRGILAANYNNGMPGAGPASVQYSYDLIHRFLDASGLDGKYTVKMGSHPMQYMGHPSYSDGVDFIIDEAKKATEDDPLWVVGLGAATDLASAVLIEPSIMKNVRYVFHARSEYSWPQRSMQFNVKGDIHAARTILNQQVPLVWFDTGTNLTCPKEITEAKLLHTGGMGRFLCEYRLTHPWFSEPNKGFYDMGDIVWLIMPDACKQEIIDAPSMDEYMFFHHNSKNGKMLRVYDIDNSASWKLLFDSVAENYTAVGGKK